MLRYPMEKRFLSNLVSMGFTPSDTPQIPLRYPEVRDSPWGIWALDCPMVTLQSTLSNLLSMCFIPLRYPEVRDSPWGI